MSQRLSGFFGEHGFMSHAKVPNLPLAERIIVTIGEASALLRRSPASVYERLDKDAADDGQDRPRLRSIKVDGRRLIFIDSICAVLGITRGELPNTLLVLPPRASAPRPPSAAKSAASKANAAIARRQRWKPTSKQPRGSKHDPKNPATIAAT
jgi:hypothetical protein